MVLKKKPSPSFASETAAIQKEITVAGKTFRLARAVTLSSWKWIDGVAKYFHVEAAIHAGRESATKKKGKQMGKANVMTVTNLEDGMQYQLVLGQIIFESLLERYPSDGYVGKSFMAVRRDVPGKRYKNYSVMELEESA
jgi:hypothetical protein